MQLRRAAWAAALVWLACVAGGAAEEVEVIADSAKVKVQNEVIATVAKGERLTVIRREGPWAAVTVKTAQGERRGWVLVTHVRPVVAPGVDERSPAPAAPKLVELSVDATQCVSYSNPPALCFELTIANYGAKAALFDPAKVKLTVDGSELKCVFGGVEAGPGNYLPVSVPSGDGRVTQLPVQQLKRIPKGELAAGAKATGWFGFAVPMSNLPQMQPRMMPPGDDPFAAAPVEKESADAKPKSWLLAVPLGEETGQLDLADVELKVADPKIRGASLDRSVEVLEVGSRINAINGANVAAAMDRLTSKRKPYVVLCRSNGCLIDSIAGNWLMMRTSQQPPGTVYARFASERPEYGPYSMPFMHGGLMRHAKSEDAAVIDVLALRSDAAGLLIAHLSNRSAELRAAAARGLARHVHLPEAADALVKAADDVDALVRTAAVAAMGGLVAGNGTNYGPGMPYLIAPQEGGQPPRPPEKLQGSRLRRAIQAADDPVAGVRSAAVTVLARADDPQATAALVKALRDADPSVRIGAARSAGSHPAGAVAQPLIDALSEKDAALTAAACESLGRLKVEAAATRLRQLQAGGDRNVAVIAVNALKAIGSLSELEAALAKLDLGGIEQGDFDVLARAKDRRCVPGLIAMLHASQQDSYRAGNAARVLAEMGEKSAVEPMLQAVGGGYHFPEEYPRALGKLGDRRAVEPLKKALVRWKDNTSLHGVVLEGLLMLDVPEAVEQAASIIKKFGNSYQSTQVIQAMGRSGRNLVLPVLEPLLEDAGHCQVASQALADIATPEATAVLKKRLLAPDYPHAQNVLMGLLQRPSMHQTGALQTQQKQVRQVFELLRELMKSDNVELKKIAEPQLQDFEQRLLGGQTSAFQQRIASRSFDAADSAFQGLFDCYWAVAVDDPGRMNRMNMHVDGMLGAYDRAGESERADRVLARIAATLQANARQGGDDAARQALFQLRARRLTSRLQDQAKVEAVAVRKIMAEAAQRIRAADAAQPRPAEIDSGMTLAGLLESTRQWDLAAEAYRALADAVPDDTSKWLVPDRAFFNLHVRRMQLVGKPLELSGVRTDRKPFDWAAYRGKVVLVYVWATWCLPSPAERAHVKQLYRLYKDRGFDVVGVNMDGDGPALDQFLDKENLPWATVRDKDTPGRPRMVSEGGLVNVPVMLLVDKQGKVASLNVGGDELERMLGEQLGPPYRPKGKLTPVDLSARSRHRRDQMRSGEPENNLGQLPGGEQTLGGVLFKVGDAVVQLSGRQQPGSGLPEADSQAEGLVVGRRVQRLYFLHGAQFSRTPPGVTPGTTIGRYVVHYADGPAETIPIVAGEDVRDWRHADGVAGVARAVVAWTNIPHTPTAAGRKLRLYLSAWDNPRPDRNVTTIDFVSAGEPAAPFCVAVTAEEPPAAR